MSRRATLAGLLLFCSATSAQTPRAVLKSTDSVPGIGRVDDIDQVAVLEDGTWFALVKDTLNLDQHLLRDGQLVLSQSDTLPSPPGAILENFRELGASPSCSDFVGILAFDLGATQGEGLFQGTQLLFRTGGLLSAPEVASGTTYSDLVGSTFDERDGGLLIAQMDDPMLPGKEYGVVRIDADFDPNGDGSCDEPPVFSEHVLHRRGDIVPPGSGRRLLNVLGVARTFARNTRGDYLFYAAYSVPRTAAVVLNGSQTIAEWLAPVPGGIGTFGSMLDVRVDLNDFGEHVYASRPDFADPLGEVLLKNGVKYRQTGDPVPDPSAGSFALVNLGNKNKCNLPPPQVCFGENPYKSAPVFITNSGDVIWFGEWDDPLTSRNEGLFLNDMLLVREGVSTDTAGALIDDFAVETAEFRSELDVSPDGRFVVFEALRNGSPAIFELDLGASVPFGVAPQGCSHTYPDLGLQHTSGRQDGFPLIGQTFRCSIASGPPGTVATKLRFATSPSANFPCGIPVVQGALLIDLSTVVATYAAGPGPVSIPVTLPNDPALVGFTAYAQAFYEDARGRTIGTTNGLRFVFGDPTP